MMGLARRRIGWMAAAIALSGLMALMAPGFGLVRAQDAKKEAKEPVAEAKDPKAAKEKDKEKEEGDGDDKAKPGVAVRIATRHQTLVGKPDEVKITTDAVKFINEKLRAAWTENKVQPSRFVNDYEFIRRVSLDIIGRVAKTEEIRKYMNYPEASRRPQIIEDLLAHEEYPHHWAAMWSNWLLSRSGVFGRGKYHSDLNVWLEDQFAQNVTYNKLVSQLVTANGKNTDNPAVNFILAHLGENNPAAKRAEEGMFEMVPITSRITRLFLGMQLQCAQCHDHPFNNAVTQKHFWGVNAFLRQVERTGMPPMERARMMTYPPLTLTENKSANKEGLVYYEKRNGVVLPTKATFIDGAKMKATESQGRREQLAAFLVEHDSFPRAVTNRMWGVFFGRGFTNPIDDFNDQNVPSLPELLDGVATNFKQYNFDLKRLIRWICNSDAYHLSYVGNKTNEKQETDGLFSRMQLKSMSPEQLFESLMVATKAEAAESKDGKRQLRERWLDNLVSNFGDDEGNEVNFNGTVVQALLMMNGDDINAAITRKDKGAVSMAYAKAKGNPAGVINDLYLSALNRPASPKEMAAITAKLKLRIADKDPLAPYQDLFWALLNSNEFLLNH
jgi:hypothetical protein